MHIAASIARSQQQSSSVYSKTMQKIANIENSKVNELS